jgi:RNA polymerase sigma-70 factor (ECF subfamily)
MDVESKITLKQERFLIQGLLQKLDPIDRAAIIMYYWYGFPYDEISAVLHLSLSAVKSRLHRARKAMAVEWMKTQPDLRSRERRLNESSTI